MDAALDFTQTMLRASLHSDEAEVDPLVQYFQQILLLRPSIAADHGHVKRDAGLEAGMGQQHGHELVL